MPPGEGWRPIADAPRDGTRVEVYAPSMGVCVAWWVAGTGAWAEELGAGYMAPFQDWTHWRMAIGNDART